MRQVAIKGIYLLAIFATCSVYAQQEIKICALRVDFQPDQNPLTTGDGLFSYDRSRVTPFTVDPPPHDRAYFQDQLVAVHNYFQEASRGRLIITGTVFPRNQSAAYRLPQDMGFYNPNTTLAENNLQLARLFIDAVAAADQDPDIAFDRYDLITVFHAGVGKDIDLGYDTTPQDLPSLYIDANFFSTYFDPNFSGIPVTRGVHKIYGGIILPETESQEGLEVALTGIFAANIGSFLGLYDLFSPSTQKSGVGRFGLMDIGLFNLYGLAPAMPCAFSRELLGWDTPEQIPSPTDSIVINRFKGVDSNGSTVCRIPISDDEYYLLEYRGDSTVKIDSLYAVESASRYEPPTYLEILKTYFADDIEVSDSTGVLLKVKDYDWGLPGAGVLIWHIDQSVIAEKGSRNAINDDRDNRAVDLEEADGSQDIGYDYTFIEPGYRSEQGTWLDFWFRGNPAPLYTNEFSPASAPNTRTNRVFANSHITINNFSEPAGDRMTFSYRRTYFEPGFPLQLNESTTLRTFSDLLTAELDEIDRPVVVTADDSGNVLAFTATGEGLFGSHRYAVAKLARKEMPALTMADRNGNQRADMLITCQDSGLIRGFAWQDLDNDNYLDTLFTVTVNGNIVTPAVVFSPYFYVGTSENLVYRFTFDGRVDSVFQSAGAVRGITVTAADQIVINTPRDSTLNFPPAVVDLNSDGAFDRVFLNSRSELVIDLSGTVEKRLSLPVEVIAAPAFGDVNGDGFYEIFFNSGDRVYGFYPNGAAVDNFPVSPPLFGNEQLTGTPLLFDANGDGRTDIVCASSHGQVFAYDLEGKPLPDFPFAAGGTNRLSPLVTDLDGDGHLELFLITRSGNIFAWQLESSENANTTWWNQSAADYTRNTYLTRILKPVPSTGADLLPAETVYNYPNPNTTDFTIIRYYLRESARITIKIFDLAGDVITTLAGPGQGQQHNEVYWNLKNISSGVYLCRVEARTTEAQQVRFLKILVVK